MLAGSTEYGTPVDVWACACLAAEMSSGRPLFPGEDEGEVVSLRAAAGIMRRSSGRISLMHNHMLSWLYDRGRWGKCLSNGLNRTHKYKLMYNRWSVFHWRAYLPSSGKLKLIR